MNDAVSQLPPESDSEHPYISQFRLHLTEVRAHLAGLDGDDLQPSFIPPTGYWTPSEKNVFFHALSVHSRLRPDLVAASIGTKSVVDVCAYIDHLDKAISRDRRVLLPRSELPCAFEVSNAWALREEFIAEDAISLEASWMKEILLLQREEEVAAKRAASQGGAQTIRDEGAVKTLDTWENDKRRHWSQEDALSKLDVHHLKVMENILRDKEGGDVNAEDSQPEDQEPEELGCLPPPDNEPPDRIPQTSLVSDGMIDPVLLQLSGVPVPDQHFAKDPSFQQHPEALAHIEHPHDRLPVFSAASSPPPPPPAPLTLQPLDYPRLPSPEGDRETAVDHAILSPASRRRIQKRLHMRRKRAARRGEVVIEATAKLRPGRKAKQRQNLSKPRGRKSTAGSELGEDEGDTVMDLDQNYEDAAMSTKLSAPEEVSQEVEADKEDEGHDSDASQAQRRNKGGMTRPYKIKRDFAAKGIDADTLIDGSLGLFHLSSLSRLMTFYKSGYDVKGSNAATSISADTIRLLSAILVEFVTEVVNRSIISREQENSMKAGIKVYHQTSEDITADNVTHALEIMGMVGLTKEQYFAQLLGEDLPEEREIQKEDDDEGADESDGAGEDDNDEDENDHSIGEASTTFPLLLPVHRETHPPLISLPKSPQLNVSAPSGRSVSVEDHLLPTEMDDGEFFVELDDEMDLDAAEQVLAFEYEAELWRIFGR